MPSRSEGRTLNFRSILAWKLPLLSPVIRRNGMSGREFAVPMGTLKRFLTAFNCRQWFSDFHSH